MKGRAVLLVNPQKSHARKLGNEILKELLSLNIEADIYSIKENPFINKKGVNTPPLWGVKLGVRGICSPAYAKISMRNLKYPAALRRGILFRKGDAGKRSFRSHV